MHFKRPELKSKMTGTTTLPVCGKDVDLHSYGWGTLEECSSVYILMQPSNIKIRTGWKVLSQIISVLFQNTSPSVPFLLLAVSHRQGDSGVTQQVTVVSPSRVSPGVLHPPAAAPQPETPPLQHSLWGGPRISWHQLVPTWTWVRKVI